MARPMSFEPDEALEAIKQTFWTKGFEATSMQDIEAATGLRKQSLYRLYGDKQGMYRAALAHYEENEIAGAEALLAEDRSPRARIERLFGAVLDAARTANDRRGCFLCNASVDVPLLDGETTEKVRMMTERMRRAFRTALAGGRDDPETVERAADAILALYSGLRILIKAGAKERTLRNIVDQASALAADR